MTADAHAGGMLASWMRLKYPHILDGAIAGSAPIWSYLGEHPVRSPSTLAHIAPEDEAHPDPPCRACACHLQAILVRLALVVRLSIFSTCCTQVADE